MRLALIALLLSLLFGCGRPPPKPPAAAAEPCTATECVAMPANHAAPAGLWGVKADAASDDAAALNAAFAYCAAHAGVKVLLTGTSRAARTVTIPGGCAVEAVGATAGDPVTSHIVCDLAVSPCVAAGEADRKAVVLHGLHIGRADGAIPPGSVGLVVAGGNPVIEDLIVSRSDTCARFYATSGDPTAFGYAAHIERGFIFACPAWPLEFVGWPEAIIHGLRIGGAPFPETPDYDSKGVIHVTGGPNVCPTGAGPDGVELSDTYVLAANKADGSMAIYDSLWDFSGLNDPCGNVQIFSFVHGHVEEVRHLVKSDAGTPAIDAFRFEHSTWVGGLTDQGTNWIALDPATQVLRWTIADDDVYFWNMTPNCGVCLAPDAPIEGLAVDNLRFYGRTDMVQAGPVNVQIAAPAGSWGRLSGLDMVGGGAIAVTGPGARGIAVTGTFAP